MPLHVLVVILILLITGLSLGYFIVLLRQAADNTDVSFAVGRLPQDVPRGVPVVAPDEVDKAFDKFVALGDYTGPCLTEFKWSELSDFQIEMQIDDAGTLFLLRNKDGQLVKNRYAAGKQMCVVGGLVESTTFLRTAYFDTAPIAKEANSILNNMGLVAKRDNNRFVVAHNFYVNWIHEITEGSYGLANVKDYYVNARKDKKKILSPDFSVPEKIVITGQKKMTVQWTDAKQPNGELGKEDGNWLYVADKDRVCLFGTFGGGNTCYADSKGLDNDCLLSEQGDFFEEHNLPYLIRNKKVPTCS